MLTMRKVAIIGVLLCFVIGLGIAGKIFATEIKPRWSNTKITVSVTRVYEASELSAGYSYSWDQILVNMRFDEDGYLSIKPEEGYEISQLIIRSDELIVSIDKIDDIRLKIIIKCSFLPASNALQSAEFFVLYDGQKRATYSSGRYNHANFKLMTDEVDSAEVLLLPRFSKIINALLDAVHCY